PCGSPLRRPALRRGHPAVRRRPRRQAARLPQGHYGGAHPDRPDDRAAVRVRGQGRHRPPERTDVARRKTVTRVHVELRVDHPPLPRFLHPGSRFMFRAAACVALLSLVVVPAVGRAEDPEPIKLTLSPAALPTPSVKYHLLPEPRDLVPGNAA